MRDVQGFFGLGGAPIYQVRVIVLTKQEENDALRAAHVYVKQQAQGNEGALADQELLIDSKHVEVVFRACKQTDSNMPAFPGPQWMREHMSADELAVLVNVVNEVRAKCGPIDYTLDRDTLDAMRMRLARYGDTELPDLVLERVPREVLTSMVVLLAQDLQRALDAAAALDAATAPTEPVPETEEPPA